MKLFLSVAALGMGASVATAVATQASCSIAKSASSECVVACDAASVVACDAASVVACDTQAAAAAKAHAQHLAPSTSSDDAVAKRQRELEALAQSAPSASGGISRAPAESGERRRAFVYKGGVLSPVEPNPKARAEAACEGSCEVRCEGACKATCETTCEAGNSRSVGAAPKAPPARSGGGTLPQRFPASRALALPAAPSRPARPAQPAMPAAPAPRAFDLRVPDRQLEQKLRATQRSQEEHLAQARKRLEEAMRDVQRAEEHAELRAREAVESAQRAAADAQRAAEREAQARTRARVEVHPRDGARSSRELQLEERVRQLEQRLQQLEGGSRSSTGGGARESIHALPQRVRGDGGDCTPNRARVVTLPRGLHGQELGAPQEPNVRWLEIGDGRVVVLDGQAYQGLHGVYFGDQAAGQRWAERVQELVEEHQEDWQDAVEDWREAWEEHLEEQLERLHEIELDDLEELEPLEETELEELEADEDIVRRAALSPLEAAKALASGVGRAAGALFASPGGVRSVGHPAPPSSNDSRHLAHQASILAPLTALGYVHDPLGGGESLDLHGVVGEMRAELDALRATLRDLRDQVRASRTR